MNEHRIVRITRDDYRKIRQGLVAVTAGRFGRQQVARLDAQTDDVQAAFRKYGIDSSTFTFGGVVERCVGPDSAVRWFMLGATEQGLAFLTPMRLSYASQDASIHQPKDNRQAAA